MTAVTSSSTTSANMAPLVDEAAPTGSIDPARPAAASVVGCPLASSAQPAGMARPSLAATISLPRAASLKDRSIIKGEALRRGKTAATGLVPKMGCLPPAAGMAAGELAKPRPTMPASATARRWSTTTPQWWLRTTPATATPCSRAVRMASRMARSQAGKAKPSPASISSALPLRWRTAATAEPTARPLRRWVLYCATRLRPWPAWPWASAITNARAVLSAMLRLAPAACKARDTNCWTSWVGSFTSEPPAPWRQ